MKSIIKLALLFLFVLNSFVAFSQDAFPLQVNVNIAAPYPVRLSDYTDFDSQIFITIMNNSSETYDINLLGSLTNNDDGTRIETNINRLPSRCFSILPGTTTLSGADLREVFDPNHLTMPAGLLNRIKADEALPQGVYSLCLRAVDCGMAQKALSPAADMMQGCFTFPVDYVQPPQIMTPFCGDNVAANQDNLVFNWTPAVSMSPGRVNYRIRIVEIDPPGRDPNLAIQSSTGIYLYDQGEIMGTSHNVFLNADVTLIQGKSYAYQVIAYDPDGNIQFENNGASEVCWFTYGSDTGDFHFSPTYPNTGDYIPFRFFPIVVKFNPYSDTYIEFNGELDLKEKIGGSYQTIDSHSPDSRWPRGPREGQEEFISGITEEQSQNLPVFKNQTETSFEFQRGKEYAYDFSGSMDLPDGDRVEDAIERVEFISGMSPSVLRSPEDRSVVEAGNINLEWTTAKKPTALVAPNIIQVSGGDREWNMFNPDVNERWFLEVSESNSFDSLYFTTSEKVEYSANETNFNEAAIEAALYKDISKDTLFADNSTYYWRVKWLTNPDDLTSEAYSVSPIWSFKTGAPREETPIAEETPGGCEGDCEIAVPTNTTAVAVTGNPTLRIGKFNMRVTTINSSGSNQYSGEGTITVSFLNDIQIRVAFENIKVNSDNQIFEGNVNAADDEPQFSTSDLLTNIEGLPVNIPSLTEDQANALDELMDSGERLVSLIGNSRPMGMPLGMDKEIDDNRYVIAITEMNFTPRNANITAIARLDIPGLGEKLPAFGARDVCITPTGFGGKYALYLAKDHEIYSSGDFKFVFNGTMDGDTTKSSYIEFDCTGFKCARLSGTVDIPNNKLIPEDEEGEPIPDGTVKGTFAFKGCRGSNYMGSISLSAFQIKGMKGWGFNPIIAYLDWSDLENPPDFTVPENYEFAGMSEGRLVNSWKGFYLKELSLHAPPEFDHDIVGDVEANVQNVIIDETGFTGSVAIMNLIDYDDGEVEGWAFSLDSLAFGVVQNTNISGGFRGKLGTPIFDEDDYLSYSAAITFVSDTLNYNFRVFVKDTLGMDIWKARVTLTPDSQILFKGGTSIDTELSMDLNGTVSIEGDLGVPQLSLPGIEFQALHLSTKDQFSIGHIGFTSPQKSAAGFPLNIDDIGFSGGFSNPTIDFDLALTLSNAGFSAKVGLEIIGETFTDENDRIKLRYGRTRLDAITINQQMDGGISIDGSLEFYREDPVYGKGMKGEVAVGLPMDIAVSARVQFGTIHTDPTAAFNTAGYFSYWYVDGSVRLPAHTVTLFPGFELRGFGGGAFHHMALTTDPNTEIPSDPDGKSGAVYAPDFPTVLGLKASIVMAMAEEKTFNMDVGIEAEFRDYGLSRIVVSGDGYIMAGFDERDEAKVTANVEVSYHNDGEGNKRVQGNFDVFVNVDPILTGSGPDNLFVRAEFLADGDTWHFYMGKQPEDERSGLDLNVYLLQAEIRSYLMVGHGIPPGLPPLPQEVRDLLYGPQQASIEGAVQGGSLDREMPFGQNDRLSEGKGFAMGAHLHFGADMDFAIFYAKLDLWAGFDINISQNADRVCYETGLHPGINDWYATGQVYVALKGELGVQVNLFFIRGRFPIIELGAAVSLSGGVPKPVWMEGRAGLSYRILGGLIKGHCNFSVQAGQKCSYTDPNPFSDIEFISSFSPDHGDEDISVFTTPQVSFALPVNEILELPAGLEDEPERVRTFYPFVETSRTILRDLDHNENVEGSYHRGAENVTGSFQPVGALESQSRHKFEVVVRSREYFPNGTIDLVKVEGNVWEEVKSVTFKTGDRPDVIEEAQVAYTYPIDRQAYFLKNETSRGRGLLKYMGSTQNYLFEEVDADGNPYTFFARYIKLDDDSEARGEISLGRDRLYFGVPSNLQNSSIYGVQIVRKNYEAPRSVLELAGDEVRNTNAIDVPQSSTILEAFNLRDSRGLLAGTAELELNAVQLLPAEIARPSEKVLYSFYFRTSKFNSLQEKLGTVPLNAEYFYAGGFLFEHVKLNGKMEEPFDKFEVNGLFKNGSQVLDPMLTFMDLQSNSYFRGTAQYYIYNLRNELRRLNGTRSSHPMGLNYRIDLRDFNSTIRGQSVVNIMPFKTISLNSNSDIGRPLADWELDRAAGINEYAPSSSTASSSSSNNSNLSTNLSSMIGGTNYSMGGLTSGINTGSSNIMSHSALMGLGGGGSSATQDFNLIFSTSMYVKLDAMEFQQQLSRWMATSRRLLSSIISVGATNSEMLLEDNSMLHGKISRFISAPLSTFHYRNGNYQYRIGYRYPGYHVASGITKSFNINYHDESLR